MDGYIKSLQPQGVWTDSKPLYLVFGGKQLRSAASDITEGDREEEALEECDVKGRGGETGGVTQLSSGLCTSHFSQVILF